MPVLNDKFADFQSRLPGFAEDLKNRKTTRIILWEEYREQVPEGYGRSQFCEHLCRYQESRKAVMHFDHSPAELLEFFRVMLPSICICGTCVDCFDITAIFISKNIIYKKSLSC